MLYKNTLLKIKKSFGRYLSLFVIVLVGVGFYAGIQSTAPDLYRLADRYYQEHHLADFKIVSTLGLTDDDIAALQGMDSVAAAVGSYSLDVLGDNHPVRIHAIEENCNTGNLVAGRMPENNGECLADCKNYAVGDVITIAGDVSGLLRSNTFTVTGLIESVLYVSYDYGSTTVGDGKLSSFIFVNKDCFTLDAYTEIYVAMDGSEEHSAYSGEYKALVKILKDALVKIKPDRENARYLAIYNETDAEISKSEAAFKTQQAEGARQLADAKAQLDANARKLESAQTELKQNERNLEDAIQKQTAEFDAAKEKIEAGWQEVDVALRQSGIGRDVISSKIAELQQAISNLQLQLSQASGNSSEYMRLSETIAALTVQQDGLYTLKRSADTLTEQETALNEGIRMFQEEISKSKAELETGKEELLAGEEDLEEGYREYNRNLEKFQAETADAEAKIADARKRLSEIEQPRWTIFGREFAAGFAELESDIDVVASIAKVFPIFFILIAMLMTSNTMARMIAEERGELGALTSLGFQDGQLIRTYLLYVLSASVFGAAAGYFIGCNTFPYLIYSNYDYHLPALSVYYDWLVFAAIIGITVLLMSIVTVAACMRELKEKPAALMRPLPPKRGQKILLERIGFLWKHLSFIWKITIRNMVRYKKRALMTVVGVAGCSALLLVGFGLRGSMDGIADAQYGGIFRYDNMMVLKNETQGLESGGLMDIFEEAHIENPLLLLQSAVKCESGASDLNAFLTVPSEDDLFYKQYHLKSKIDGADILLNDSGVVITEKLADSFDISKGDPIVLKDAENNEYQLMVSDVSENYLSNYVYMSDALYAEVFGQTALYNTVVSNFSGDEQLLASRLIDTGFVINITFVSDMIQTVLDGNARLNSIVILLIAVASLLAIIVLYNLTSINISERKREIATLKVLGFRDGETNAYIYREAVLLTIISIAVGLLLGVLLHRFVIVVIEGTARVLFKKISWQYFLISGLMTMAFSIIMQVVTYFKLRTINMVESLKSVE